MSRAAPRPSDTSIVSISGKGLFEVSETARTTNDALSPLNVRAELQVLLCDGLVAGDADDGASKVGPYERDDKVAALELAALRLRERRKMTMTA